MVSWLPPAARAPLRVDEPSLTSTSHERGSAVMSEARDEVTEPMAVPPLKRRLRSMVSVPLLSTAEFGRSCPTTRML